MFSLAIAGMTPRPERKPAVGDIGPEAGPAVGTIGLAWAHDPRTDSGGGSAQGGIDINCDAIRDWGAAAVLSLTDPAPRTGIAAARTSLLPASGRAGMYWFHLPIAPGRLPAARFEADWVEVGDALRRLIRNGCRVVVHCEDDLARSAMIIARLYIELGCYEKDPFRDLHGFKAGIIPDRVSTGYVLGQRMIDPPQPKTTPAAIRDRAVGALVGLAVGDALGTTLEFKARDTYPHLTDMVGGGPFRLNPGEWTDDTAMALALAEDAPGARPVRRLGSSPRAEPQGWRGVPRRQAEPAGTQSPAPPAARSHGGRLSRQPADVRAVAARAGSSHGASAASTAAPEPASISA